MIDAHTIEAEVSARVKSAREAAGSAAWLVGYDVNGIQAYVTANSRPVAMEGASALIKAFDDEQRKHPGAVFAGGGRGLFLVDYKEATRLVKELPQAYFAETVSGVLATASVPWSEEKAFDTLRWLRFKLESSKDAAIRPGDFPPLRKQDQCDRCREYRGVDHRPVGDDKKEFICKRCVKITKRGSRQGQSLIDLSPHGWIAAISADGNNLGDLFASLRTLEQTAAVSEAVREIFRFAHAAAIAQVGDPLHVAPVTGGDDIRVFLAPEHVEGYVSTLAREVERCAERMADLGEALRLDSDERQYLRQQFAELGVGIGVVVAGNRTSASWLMTHAHTLERSAKTLCRPGRSDRARSALDFAVLTTDEAFLAGVPTRVRGSRGRRPVSLDEDSWRKYVDDTRSLAKVPAAQRAVLAESAAMLFEESTGEATALQRTALAESATMPSDEFINLFRYQVARSRAWQAWYAETGSDWKDPKRVVDERPDALMLELLRILEDGR